MSLRAESSHILPSLLLIALLCGLLQLNGEQGRGDDALVEMIDDEQILKLVQSAPDDTKLRILSLLEDSDVAAASSSSRKLRSDNIFQERASNSDPSCIGQLPRRCRRRLQRCRRRNNNDDSAHPVPKKHVLVSGYGSWWVSDANPAGAAALFLNGTCLEPTEEYPFEVCFEGQIMSVDEDGTAVVANQIRNSFEERQDGTVEWDAVIQLGLDVYTKGMKLELVASNLLSIDQFLNTTFGEIEYNPMPIIDASVDIYGCEKINSTNKYLCDGSGSRILTYGRNGRYVYASLM